MRYAGVDGRDVTFVADEATSVAAALASVGVSKRQASRVLGEGRLLVDGEPVASARDDLPADAPVTLRLAHTPPIGSAPDELVLYCDPFLLAVNKPASLLVHGDGTGARTLTDEVASWLRAHGSDAHPQALQRLDVGTTGIVLFSLAEEFQPAFDALVAGETIQGRGLTKHYLAVAEGEVPDDLRLIDAPIGRDRHDARRMRVSPTGKPARTHVCVLAHHGGRTLLELRLETGRRHQIRVHLAGQEYPLVGDALYGRPAPSGLALHAWHTTLTHPVTGDFVDIRTPWPKRFEALGFPASDGGLSERSDAQ